MEQVAEPLREEVELVHAAQRGDRDAFGRLYDASVTSVYRYLRSRLAEPSDAEDLTADVFIKAMQALPSYRHQGVPFVAWLFRIAHNQAVNHLKKSARRRETPLGETHQMETATAYDGPEEEVLGQVRFTEVVHAMGDLTDLQREVLNLRFAADLSIAEVANVMSRKEGAVKFLQFSALRALRRVWGQQEAASHED